MRTQKTFGRRAPRQAETKVQRQSLPVEAEVTTAPAPPQTAELQHEERNEVLQRAETDIDVDRELEEWKASRKAHKRSIREPWRSLALSSAVGFGLSSWLLPDSVANIAELVTGGLGAASVFAGFRVVQAHQPSTSKSDDRF